MTLYFFIISMDKNLFELIEHYENTLVDKQLQVIGLCNLRHGNNYMACTAKYVKEINILKNQIRRLHIKINQLRLKYWYWK